MLTPVICVMHSKFTETNAWCASPGSTFQFDIYDRKNMLPIDMYKYLKSVSIS